MDRTPRPSSICGGGEKRYLNLRSRDITVPDKYCSPHVSIDVFPYTVRYVNVYRYIRREKGKSGLGELDRASSRRPLKHDQPGELAFELLELRHASDDRVLSRGRAPA